LITEAYNVLSNDEYRRKYDSMRPTEKDDGDMPSGEEYMNYMNKTTRKKTAAEWSKVRRGIRSQE
jgi:DnaJ-class molecular chaperone